MAVFILLAAAALPAAASTVSPPANLGELARMSRSVVLAESLGTWSELAGDTPVTITRFQLVKALSGANPGPVLEVRQLGGEAGGVGMTISGMVHFAKGTRYVLFLDPAAAGRWQPRMLAYGILEEDAAAGLLRPVRETAELQLLMRPGVEKIGTYRRDELLRSLAGAAHGSPWAGKAALVAEAETVQAETAQDKSTAGAPALVPAGSSLKVAPAACQYMSSNDSLPVRWFGFETGASVAMWHTTPGQAGIADGGLSAVQQGIAAWADDPNTVINMTYGGSRARSATCANGLAEQRGVNEVTFNDPCNEIADLSSCNGTVAVGGVFYNPNSTQTYDGATWRPIDSGFVVVNNGTECLGDTDFKEMVTHNLGHSLGFWHHNDQEATMYVSLGVHAPRGAAIARTDQLCSAYDYHTFLDVPLSNFAWKFIEAVQNAGVTGGCGGGNFCPGGGVTRAQMAVFLLVAKEGTSYTPPACTTPVFGDVPCSSPFAPWINELAARGVVAGCGNGNYCPNNPVTRAQVSVFLIATKEGTSYTPPACTTPPFNDVPCSSPFAPWIKELVDRGLTGGCNPGNYCPGNTITRAEMSVFLTGNFSLPFPNYP